MMKLLEQWRHYMGPADERIERETNRIYKYGFYLLAIGSLATLYYAGALEQIAYVNNLTLETEAMSTVVPDPAQARRGRSQRDLRSSRPSWTGWRKTSNGRGSTSC